MHPESFESSDIQSPRTLRVRIMRRIYRVFLLRNLAPFAFDCLLIVAAVFVVTIFVSLKHVWENFSTASAHGGISAFSFDAISHTELETKLLLLFLGVVGFLAIRDLKRAARALRVLREGTQNKSQITNKF